MLFMEYVIENTSNSQYLVLSGGRSSWTKSLFFALKIKKKERGVALAARHGGTLQPYFGSDVPRGTKSSVSPKQSPTNRRSAYRSI